ncbi:MAG: hypothetical protein PHR87_04595 [Sulfurospirillaceae bacterium]|nr:hypothetical protein [Sulfurospirillaceae bacterium]
MMNKGVLQYQQAQHDSRGIEKGKIIGKIMQKAMILGNTFFQNRDLVTSLYDMPYCEENDEVLIKALFHMMKECSRSEKIACMSSGS